MSDIDSSRFEMNTPPSETPSSPQTGCYFSITPSIARHYSSETPATSPLYGTPHYVVASELFNPLLAYRPTPTMSSPKLNSINLLQLQTQAAYSSVRPRPQPRPLQNVLAVGDDSETSDSSSSDDSSTSYSFPNVARCSRCQRTSHAGAGNSMVQYGLNLHYCTRCAGIVGLGNR